MIIYLSTWTIFRMTKTGRFILLYCNICTFPSQSKKFWYFLITSINSLLSYWNHGLINYRHISWCRSGGLWIFTIVSQFSNQCSVSMAGVVFVCSLQLRSISPFFFWFYFLAPFLLKASVASTEDHRPLGQADSLLTRASNFQLIRKKHSYYIHRYWQFESIFSTKIHYY